MDTISSLIPIHFVVNWLALREAPFLYPSLFVMFCEAQTNL